MQEAIQYLTEKDSIFKLIIEKYGLPIIPKRPQGFETLVLLILEQQVSIDSAKATFLKLKAKHPDFNPESLLLFTDEDYRNSGVSRQKNPAVRSLPTSCLLLYAVPTFVQLFKDLVLFALVSYLLE
jgi:DNA-3-methyladenine glycosylase II